MERLPKLKVTPLELKQPGERTRAEEQYGYFSREVGAGQPLSWESEDFARDTAQTQKRSIRQRAGGYIRAGRMRITSAGRRLRAGSQRTGKREDRPIAFFTTLGGQIAVCTAIILCALVLKSIDNPAAQAVSAGVKDAVTMDVDLDQTLGKLKFVQNLFPDTVAVLSQEKAPESLQPPFNGKVTEKFSTAMPGIEISGDKQGVFACYEGKVAECLKGDDGLWSVTVEHTGGLSTIYQRLSGVTVAQGERVKKGEQVGVGQQSGEGYAMFLMAKLDGEIIDPLPYFK